MSFGCCFDRQSYLLNTTIITTSFISHEPILLFHSALCIFSNDYINENLIVENIVYSSIQQYYQSQKARYFHDENIYKQIKSVNNPKLQKAYGRSNKKYRNTEWQLNCDYVMKKGLVQKVYIFFTDDISNAICVNRYTKH